MYEFEEALAPALNSHILCATNLSLQVAFCRVLPGRPFPILRNCPCQKRSVWEHDETVYRQNVEWDTVVNLLLSTMRKSSAPSHLQYMGTVV